MLFIFTVEFTVKFMYNLFSKKLKKVFNTFSFPLIGAAEINYFKDFRDQ